MEKALPRARTLGGRAMVLNTRGYLCAACSESATAKSGRVARLRSFFFACPRLHLLQTDPIALSFVASLSVVACAFALPLFWSAGGVSCWAYLVTVAGVVRAMGASSREAVVRGRCAHARGRRIECGLPSPRLARHGLRLVPGVGARIPEAGVFMMKPSRKIWLEALGRGYFTILTIGIFAQPTILFAISCLAPPA